MPTCTAVGSGSLGAITATGNSLVFEATLTPAAGVEDTTNVITLGTAWTDPAGNAPAAATNSNNYAVDTARPTVTILVDDAALNISDDALVTFSFSEAPTDFTIADVTAVGSGSLGAITATGNSLVFEATLTPAAGVTDATNVITVGMGWTDPAGNAPAAAATDSNNYAVDTVRPTVSIVVDDPNLNIGDDTLVTFTFSEAPSGFDAGDVSEDGSGSLGTITPTADPLVFQANLTPAAGVTDATNVITVGTGWTDPQATRRRRRATRTTTPSTPCGPRSRSWWTTRR